MGKEEGSWRQRLRSYLAATLKADGITTVGELVERFGEEIPLHIASRKWVTNHRYETDPQYPTAYKMRFYTLTQTLHWLGCTFDPPGRKTYQTMVLVHGHRCLRCGEMFVAQKPWRHGTLCPAGKKPA